MAVHKPAFYSVVCDKHGMERYKGGPNEVFVSRPNSRKQRVAGCPMCRKETKDK